MMSDLNDSLAQPTVEAGDPTVEVGDSSSEAPVSTKATSRRRRGRWFTEWAAIILLALLIALGFRTYVAQTFYIPSTSMVPTLLVGDRIVVSKLSVTWGTIHRGDVVVFRSPSNVAARCDGAPEAFLVKRVIGLPGDHLRNVGSKIYVNGGLLPEPWQHSNQFGNTGIQPHETVPKNQYFMIGDNNVDSCDSRYWGTVNRSAIVGKVVFRIWPLTRMGFL